MLLRFFYVDLPCPASSGPCPACPMCPVNVWIVGGSVPEYIHSIISLCKTPITAARVISAQVGGDQSGVQQRDILCSPYWYSILSLYALLIAKS